MTHAITLRIPVAHGTHQHDLDWITEALGECARDLEAEQAESKVAVLVPDENDEGRFAWSIVKESY